MSNRKALLTVAPLFLVLCIDGMGLGLLFPILNSIIIDPSTQFLPVSMTLTVREVYYGVAVGIFMLSWFFGAAILGDLSDTVGRKKALMICLLGSGVGYLIGGIAIMIHSYWLLVFGRMVAGFTAGSQPIAQAAIVDVSTPETKTRNIGWILLSISMGFVIGPIVGGVLANRNFISWFTFSTPLDFAALISFINFLLLWWLFDETYTVKGKLRIRFHHAATIFVSAFKHVKVRELSFVLLVMITGWSMIFSFVSLYGSQAYHFTPFQVSMFMGAMGVGFSIGCGYLVGFCARHFTLKQATITGYFLGAIATLVMVFAHSVLAAWFLLVVIGATMAVGYSDLITLFSNQVGEDEQGWVMGVTGSIMALCFGLTGLLTGMITRYGIEWPMIAGSILIIVSGFMLMPIKVNSGAET